MVVGGGEHLGTPEDVDGEQTRLPHGRLQTRVSHRLSHPAAPRELPLCSRNPPATALRERPRRWARLRRPNLGRRDGRRRRLGRWHARGRATQATEVLLPSDVAPAYRAHGLSRPARRGHRCRRDRCCGFRAVGNASISSTRCPASGCCERRGSVEQTPRCCERRGVQSTCPPCPDTEPIHERRRRRQRRRPTAAADRRRPPTAPQADHTRRRLSRRAPKPATAAFLEWGDRVDAAASAATLAQLGWNWKHVGHRPAPGMPGGPRRAFKFNSNRDQ